MKALITILMILVCGGLAAGLMQPPVGPVIQAANAARVAATTKSTLTVTAADASTTYTGWFVLDGEEVLGVEIANGSATVALDAFVCQFRDDGFVSGSGTAYDRYAGTDWLNLAGSTGLPFVYYPGSSAAYLPHSLAAATVTHVEILARGHSAVRFGASGNGGEAAVTVRVTAQ